MKFIVLEGLDCCGKTTVAKELIKRLKGSKLIQFPDRTTEIGKLIDTFLKKKLEIDKRSIVLLYSANRYEFDYSGDILICDRYVVSGAVYAAAKGLDYDWARNIDKDLPKPTKTFFINTDLENIIKRKGFGDEKHDSINFQRKIHEIYMSKVKEEDMTVIDGNNTVEVIVESILKHL